MGGDLNIWWNKYPERLTHCLLFLLTLIRGDLSSRSWFCDFWLGAPVQLILICGKLEDVCFSGSRDFSGLSKRLVKPWSVYFGSSAPADWVDTDVLCQAVRPTPLCEVPARFPPRKFTLQTSQDRWGHLWTNDSKNLRGFKRESWYSTSGLPRVRVHTVPERLPLAPWPSSQRTSVLFRCLRVRPLPFQVEGRERAERRAWDLPPTNARWPSWSSVAVCLPQLWGPGG